MNKRICALKSMLSKGASELRLLGAAERVRDARIQVLKATLAELPEVIVSRVRSKRAMRLQTQIMELQNTSADQVLAEFRLTPR